MRGSRGSKIKEATAGKRKRGDRFVSRNEPVHPSFDFALISAARLNPGPRSVPEPVEPGDARRSMSSRDGADSPGHVDSPVRAAKLPEPQPASVIDIESRLEAARERLKRAADVAPH